MSERSWGWVSARPHECLLLIRDGEIVARRQGGAVFKWPSDAVARVDTSVRRLQFTADQVTREKTGVAVTGLAVFRVVEPELAYRMLNLDDPDATASILREMFIGATRRLVANLTLEDCLTRRKDALAVELLAEIQPIVEGRGRIDDRTEQGWGVALDTLEIQDVRVLSDEVFERLQAPYREKLALDALRAEDEVNREKARLDAQEKATRERTHCELMALEEARLEAERVRARTTLEHQAQLQRERARHDAERARLAAEADAEVERVQATARVEVAGLAAEAERVRGAAEADVERLLRQVKDAVSDARLTEIALTETLPAVAQAFRGSFDKAIVTGGDMGFLSAGIGQVLGTIEAFGVRLPKAPSDRSAGRG